MHPYHADTCHSYRSVRSNPKFLDWNTQPGAFKRYPHFFRRFPIKTDTPQGRFLYDANALTFEKRYPDTTIRLRTNPSAGALFPGELYVQLRGVPGWIEGIYHYDLLQNALTLIHELNGDGLESFFDPAGRGFKGMLFLLSAAHFRSAWKYGYRSFRYCLMDTGHLLGALEAAAIPDKTLPTVVYDFDKEGLAEAFGFLGQEIFLAAAFLGEWTERSVRPLRQPLPFVPPTDYYEPQPALLEAYRQTLTPKTPEQAPVTSVPNVGEERWREAIHIRRSIRAFRGEPISKAQWEAIMTHVTAGLNATGAEDLSLYTVLHRVDGMPSGIYKDGTLIREGDFTERCGYLCLEQRLGSDGAATLFITGEPQNYQTGVMQAGWLGHRLYLAATYQGIGCSGIGAYYDEETMAFLETKASILYVLAIGR